MYIYIYIYVAQASAASPFLARCRIAMPFWHGRAYHWYWKVVAKPITVQRAASLEGVDQFAGWEGRWEWVDDQYCFLMGHWWWAYDDTPADRRFRPSGGSGSTPTTLAGSGSTPTTLAVRSSTPTTPADRSGSGPTPTIPIPTTLAVSRSDPY